MSIEQKIIVYDMESNFGIDPREQFFPLQTEIVWVAYKQNIILRTSPKLIYIHNPEIQHVPVLSFLAETIGKQFSIFIKKIDCIYYRNGYDYTLQCSTSPTKNMLFLSFGASRKIEFIYPLEKKRISRNIEEGDVLFVPKANNVFFSIPRTETLEPQITLICYFSKWGERKLCVPKTIEIPGLLSMTVWVNKREKIRKKNICNTEPEVLLHQLFILDDDMNDDTDDS